MKKQRPLEPAVLLMLVMLLVSACGTQAEPTPTPPPTATPIPPTPTAEPILTGMIDVGGFNLYIDCIGDGSPTVVLDSDLGHDSSEWHEVIALVEDNPPTRVCVYDRHGRGRSALLQREPRTTQDMVDELRALLEAAHIPGPYILAGHFLAGPNAWLFASQYPDEVAGVIMVDSTHPDHNASEREAMEPFMQGEYAAIAQAFAAPLGDYTEMPEYWDAETSFQQVTAAGPFGDIPLVVLMHDTSNIELSLAYLREYWPDVPAELVVALGESWVPVQEELAELSTNSVLINVENSTHPISLYRPDAVVDAIRQVMEMAETDAR